MKIGDSVRSVRKAKSTGHPVLTFEGVIVNINKRMLWGHYITVQNVTPTPLYDRGEMIHCKLGDIEKVEQITST